MRIGIDGGSLSNRRGFGRFARQALAALGDAPSRHEFVVLVDRPSLDQVTIPPSFETIPVHVRQAPSQAASANGQRRLLDLFAMGRAASKARLDCLFFPASYSLFPVWNVPRVVVTMHDTMPLAHPDLIFPNRRGRFLWTLKERYAARIADRVVTVSQNARRDLIAWFGLPENRIHVVPEGPSESFRHLPPGPESDRVLDRYHIPPDHRFLLYVGGLSPHKNLRRLLEAFARLDAPNTSLVLVGDLADVFHTHIPELRQTVAKLALGRRVNFTGFVPDADLAHVYSRAYALVQPSLAEGFGLPPVEAMACGTPVLSSYAGSLPEVIGDAGRFFEPTDVPAIARTLQALLDDPTDRADLARLALHRARQFTWSACARALLDTFDDLETQTAHRRSENPMAQLETGTGSESSRCLSPFPTERSPAGHPSSVFLGLAAGNRHEDSPRSPSPLAGPHAPRRSALSEPFSSPQDDPRSDHI